MQKNETKLLTWPILANCRAWQNVDKIQFGSGRPSELYREGRDIGGGRPWPPPWPDSAQASAQAAPALAPLEDEMPPPMAMEPAAPARAARPGADAWWWRRLSWR